jgi:hypothetical protein
MGDDARTCPPLPACSPLLFVNRWASLPAELRHVASGVGRRVEARILILEARVSSFERRTSIRASTTTNFYKPQPLTEMGIFTLTI